MQAPGRVDDQHVLAVLARAIERPRGDLDGVAIGALLIDLRAGLAADLDELLDRRRAVHVAGGDSHRRGVLLAQVARQLGRSRRLARALQPRHQDHRRRFRREAQARRGAAHQLGQLLADDLDDLLSGVQAADHVGAHAALLQLGRELAHDLEVDVGLEQREADLAHRRIDVLLGQRAAVADIR